MIKGIKYSAYLQTDYSIARTLVFFFVSPYCCFFVLLQYCTVQREESFLIIRICLAATSRWRLANAPPRKRSGRRGKSERGRGARGQRQRAPWTPAKSMWTRLRLSWTTRSTCRNLPRATTSTAATSLRGRR